MLFPKECFVGIFGNGVGDIRKGANVIQLIDWEEFTDFNQNDFDTKEELIDKLLELELYSTKEEAVKAIDKK